MTAGIRVRSVAASDVNFEIYLFNYGPAEVLVEYEFTLMSASGLDRLERESSERVDSNEEVVIESFSRPHMSVTRMQARVVVQP